MLRLLEIYRCPLFVRVTLHQKKEKKCVTFWSVLTAHQKQSCVLYAITNIPQHNDRLKVHYKWLLTVIPRAYETGLMKLWNMTVSDLEEGPGAPTPPPLPASHPTAPLFLGYFQEKKNWGPHLTKGLDPPLHDACKWALTTNDLPRKRAFINMSSEGLSSTHENRLPEVISVVYNRVMFSRPWFNNSTLYTFRLPVLASIGKPFSMS